MLPASMTPPPLSRAAPRSDSLWSAFLPLLPFMLAVFDGFLALGMALPVVPRHVHDTLGQGTVMVGFVMGAQYLSSVFGRIWAGGATDERGPRVAALAETVQETTLDAIGSGTFRVDLGAMRHETQYSRIFRS